MNYVITKNGTDYNLLRFTLEIPNTGSWYMYDIAVDSQVSIVVGDAVTLTIMNRTLSGTVVQATTYAGYTLLEIVAGTYKMREEFESVGYYGSTIRQIVEFVSRNTNQAISTDSDQTVLNTAVTRFDKVKTSSTNILEKLLFPIGAFWKINLDGTLFIGKENYQDISVKYPQAVEGLNYDILDQSSINYQIYTEQILFEPIFSINGNKVREVIVTLGEDTVRTQFDFYDPSFKQTQITSTDQKDILYLKKYRMKVISQSSNGDVTVVPDPDIDAFKNGLKDVPIVYPMPDMRVKVSPGAICTVEFLNGDPSFPRVTSWEYTTNLVEVTFSNSTNPKGVARLDDSVDCGTLEPVIAMGVVVGLKYTPPSSPIAIIAPPALSIPLSGFIDSSSNKVKAGN